MRGSSTFRAESAQAPKEIESIIDRFEEAWQNGHAPDISEFLPLGDTDNGWQSADVLEELVKIDLEYRWRRSRGRFNGTGKDPLSYPILENYLDKFPELGTPASISDDLIAEEYLVRRKWGDNPAHGEYEARFTERGEALTVRLRRIDADVVPDISWKSDTPRVLVSSRSEANDRASAPEDSALIGDHEILEELGRGGMGVVYRARSVLNRVVALKMILAPVRPGDEDRVRFQCEAEAAARLQHPNIVQIHEIGDRYGCPFLSLEFVDGGSLATRLVGMPQPPLESARLIETVARAMHYAHQRGVVHRDLKPGNILLAFGREPKARSANISDAIPKVSDFGLAKRIDVADGATQTGSVLGTPSYMAPEQAVGKRDEVGPVSDVYALGAILYEMLTGRPPFRGTSILDTLEQVRSQEPVAPRQLQPKLPRDIDTICLKCLQKDSRKRYESAEALANDLRRFQRSEPILARPVASWERAWKWACRRPAVAAMIGVIVLSAISLLVGGWMYTTRVRDAQHLAEENLTKAMQSLEHISLSVFEKGMGGPELEAFKKKLLTDLTIYFQTFLAHADHPNPEIRRWTGRAFKGLCMSYSLLGKYPEAEGACRGAIRIYERLTAEAPQSNIYRHDLASAHCMLGDVVGAQGRLEDAESAYRMAISLYRTLTDDSEINVTAIYNLAVTSHNFGRRLSNAREPQRALEWHDAAIEILTDLLRKLPDSKESRVTLSYAHSMRAYSMDQLSRHADALCDWDRAIELDPKGADFNRVLRARTLALSGDHEAAARSASEAGTTAAPPPDFYVNLACVYSLCGAAVDKDLVRSTDDRRRAKDQYKAIAIEWLRKAKTAGYFDQPNRLRHLLDDTDIEPLKSSAAFEQFIAELTGKAPPSHE